MSYLCGIGGNTVRIGLVPREPMIECDGCGLAIPVAPVGSSAPPAWFLDGKAPPHWRGLRSHDGSKRWDLCPRCWKGPEKAEP